MRTTEPPQVTRAAQPVEAVHGEDGAADRRVVQEAQACGMEGRAQGGRAEQAGQARGSVGGRPAAPARFVRRSLPLPGRIRQLGARHAAVHTGVPAAATPLTIPIAVLPVVPRWLVHPAMREAKGRETGCKGVTRDARRRLF
jgi:hypothetical protein